jgi:hypothetical protein
MLHARSRVRNARRPRVVLQFGLKLFADLRAHTREHAVMPPAPAA